MGNDRVIMNGPASEVIIWFYDDIDKAVTARENVMKNREQHLTGSSHMLNITGANRLPEKGDIVIYDGKSYFIDDQIFSFYPPATIIDYIASPAMSGETMMTGLGDG